MGNRVYVSFDSSYLAGLDNVTANATTLTSYQTGIVLQCLLLLNNRYLWQPMSDSAWDTLSGDIAKAINQVYVP